MADPMDDFKSLQSRGGGFLFGKRGSSWMAEILPPTRVPSVPTLLRGPAGPQPGVGGTWALEKGEPVFTVTCRRGALELSSVAAMELKRLIGSSTAPTLREAPQVDVLDGGSDPDGPGGTPTGDLLGGADLDALDLLATLDAGAIPPAPPPPALRAAPPDPGALDLEALDFLGALDDGVERGPAVMAAQARLAWVQARERARQALAGFAKEILDDFPGEQGTVSGLRGALDGLSLDLDNALDDLINAGNVQEPAARKDASDRARSAAADALTDAEDFVRDDELLAHLDERAEIGDACDRPRWRVVGDLLRVEEDVEPDLAAGLAALGHEVVPAPVGDSLFGSVCASEADLDSGLVSCWADPRRESWAGAW